MGGHILELESERLIRVGIEQGMERGIEQGREQGMERGIEQGKLAMLASLVDDGLITAQEAAKRLGLSIEEYTRRADRINI